ncbi:MAG: MFS transporter [Candidatus Nanoarchaeia archaeon]|nr:MFS transporter [Candidatus Nanoarchaeia archaeon]MDD5357775.1 MFS transporter [Candidatus Nanoarchaeia archaeon]MDD5588694.1 MFS transporter [Candidatus Nanoarchaeia archaeon]
MKRGKKISENCLKEETKKISVKEGVAYSFMDGAGLRYITPYALAIGANNAQIGFLTSIPSLLGNFSQFFTSKAVEKYPRKKIVAVSIFLQALMWIPLIILGYLFFYKNFDHGLSATLMIVFFTLMVLFGAFASPAWNSLIKDIVDKCRGEYFGKRNRILGITSILVMLACGFILNYFTKINLLLGFGIIFGIAFIARLISGYFMTKYYEPKLKLEKGYYFSFWEFIKGVPKSNFGKFTVFIGLISFAASIASPFFAVYLLRDLNLSYLIWTVVVVFNSIGTFLFMPLWGKFADKYGNLKVLKWTGAFVGAIPLLWVGVMFVLPINVPLVIVYLSAIELFSGFIWAGFNLSATNFIYDAVSNQKTALCISYYNIINGIGVFIGASIGGLLASMNFNIFGIGPLLFIFLISGIARYLIYLFMIPKIKEVRGVKEYHDGEFKKELKKMLVPPPFRFLKHHHTSTSSFIVPKL